MIVAGAGLAGLSAGHELTRAGAAVTILDAREYAGGRVRTIRDFSAGQHAELGGEFIEPDHTEVIALCETFELRLVRILRSGFTHRFRDPDGTYRLSRTAPWEALADALAPLVRRYKLAAGDSSADAVREFATLSLGDWLRQSHAPPAVQPMARALPDDQRHAIAKLAYGRATKVLLQSSTCLFNHRHARAFATDDHLGAFWDAGEDERGPASIVAFLAGGSAAAPLRDAAAGGGRGLIADLCWLGMDRAPVTAVHVGDWTSDPWARGGYAFADPAFDPAWRPLLSRRAGRLFFAGEHTSERWQGYMNGAVESGQRAARELLASQ